MRFTYGFEIEVENFPEFRRDLWDALKEKGYSITRDGSLRNWGKEIVSDVMTNIPSVKRRFKQTLDLLKESGCRTSYRTGIHVHVGTFDSPRDVYEYLKIYLMYERQIFELYPERKHNNFCVPVLDSDIESLKYISKIENGELCYDSLISGWGKYSALNLCSFPLLRTVEFRVPVTEFETERLFKFLDIVRSINNIFNGKAPIIEPKEENVLEAKEFILMAKMFNSETERPNRDDVLKLFGLKEEDEDIDALVAEVFKALEGADYV